MNCTNGQARTSWKSTILRNWQDGGRTRRGAYLRQPLTRAMQKRVRARQGIRRIAAVVGSWALATAACGSRTGLDMSFAGSLADAGEAVVPDVLEPDDASDAEPSCTVPDGAVWLDSGFSCVENRKSIQCVNGVCRDLCMLSQYALQCSSPIDGGTHRPFAPEPDPSLGCVALGGLGVPNGPYATGYCCPCQ